LIDANDPAEQLLNQAEALAEDAVNDVANDAADVAADAMADALGDQLGESQIGAAVNEIKSLEGSIDNENLPLVEDNERAGTEKDHPQGDLEDLANPDNADQYTNFERNQALIDGSQHIPSAQSDPDPFG